MRKLYFIGLITLLSLSFKIENEIQTRKLINYFIPSEVKYINNDYEFNFNTYNIFDSKYSRKYSKIDSNIFMIEEKPEIFNRNKNEWYYLKKFGKYIIDSNSVRMIYGKTIIPFNEPIENKMNKIVCKLPPSKWIVKEDYEVTYYSSYFDSTKTESSNYSDCIVIEEKVRTPSKPGLNKSLMDLKILYYYAYNRGLVKIEYYRKNKLAMMNTISKELIENE